MTKYFATLVFCVAPLFAAAAFEVSWVPGQGGGPVEEFRVYRKKANEPGFSVLGTVSPTTTQWSDPDRTPGNCYRVTAANFVGESAPLEGCANIPPAVTVIILK